MPQQANTLVYRGSVKNIRLVQKPRGKNPGRYIFEFTDDYSVFDYGKMPDTIRGKGYAIAMMTAFLFEELSRPSSWKSLFRDSAVWDRLGGVQIRDRLRRSVAGKKLVVQGLQTHYLGLLDANGRCRSFAELREPSRRILVKAVPIVAPRPVSMDSRVIWDYNALHPEMPLFLVPLENIFRFGVPKGSSLLDRVRKDSDYTRQIGLKTAPKEGEWLARPVLEFSSKLEPMDRYLSLETALNFSGLGGEKFFELSDLSLLVSVFLFSLFVHQGLDLWDGKFEFVKVNDELLLADSITPDELRITCKGTQLSKEPLRQYYKKKDPAFLRAMKEIKEDGPSSHAVQKELKARLGRPPKKLDREFRTVVEQMYRSLTYRITGSELFSGSMDLDSVVRYLQKH